MPEKDLIRKNKIQLVKMILELQDQTSRVQKLINKQSELLNKQNEINERVLTKAEFLDSKLREQEVLLENIMDFNLRVN